MTICFQCVEFVCVAMHYGQALLLIKMLAVFDRDNK